MSNTNGTVTIQQQEYEALRQQNEQLRQQVAYLEEQVRLLRHRLFGASSERRTKVSSDADGVQLSLFNEAEMEMDSSPADASEQEPEAETEVIMYARKKPQAKAREAWLWGSSPKLCVNCPLRRMER
jgi:transposase